MTDGDGLILAELRRIRELLERRQVPRDERHVQLVAAIAQAAAGTVWTARELVAHAQVSEALRSALLAACGELSARKIGKLLRRIEGVELGGWAIERCGEDSAGITWTIKPRKPMLHIA